MVVDIKRFEKLSSMLNEKYSENREKNRRDFKEEFTNRMLKAEKDLLDEMENCIQKEEFVKAMACKVELENGFYITKIMWDIFNERVR